MTHEKTNTGTTCIGVLFKDGVILAADKRATGGLMKNDFVKVFDLTKSIVTTIAGTASSCQLVVRHLQRDAKIFELKTERNMEVGEISSLANQYQYSILRSQREVVSLIIGGYDSKFGFSLYDMGPDGTMSQSKNYVVDGSGSIFIKGLFDSEYTPDLSEEEALELVEKAFVISFKNDNCSGGGFVAKVVTKTEIREVASKVVRTELVNN